MTGKDRNGAAGRPPGADGPGLTTSFDLEALEAVRTAGSDPTPALSIVAGTQAGFIVTVGSDALDFGRDQDCDVVLAGRGISRRHFRIEPGGEPFTPEIVDLDSTNGVFVDGVRVRRRILAPGNRIQIGPSTTLRFGIEDAAEISVRNRKYQESIRDALTGTYNRRFFGESLDHEIAYARRHGESLSVVLIDLDHFKRVNDELGHPAGDYVLRRVADHFIEHLRTEDLLSRYGGEEFAVLLRGQDVAGAWGTAERLRTSLAERAFSVAEHDLTVTASFGIASLGTDPGDDAGTLIGAADRRLYGAKREGRNRTVGPEESPP